MSETSRPARAARYSLAPRPTVLRRALALLLSGVVPIAPSAPSPAPEGCSKAPLQGTPPSEREWSLVASQSEHFRFRITESDRWIAFEESEWTASGLRAAGGEAWDTGRLVYRDSLAIRWADIVRLDAERGNRAGLGALIGAVAGTVAFIGIYGCDECDLGWWAIGVVPIGIALGAVAGTWAPVWRPVYCAGGVTDPP